MPWRGGGIDEHKGRFQHGRMGSLAYFSNDGRASGHRGESQWTGWPGPGVSCDGQDDFGGGAARPRSFRRIAIATRKITLSQCEGLFPVLSVCRADKNNVRRSVRRYSIVVAAALLIATAYLAYWGMIGLRTCIDSSSRLCPMKEPGARPGFCTAKELLLLFHHLAVFGPGGLDDLLPAAPEYSRRGRGRDMRSVLNVVGRPKLLSRGVIAFIEERVKSLEDQFLESALPDENQLATEKHS